MSMITRHRHVIIAAVLIGIFLALPCVSSRADDAPMFTSLYLMSDRKSPVSGEAAVLAAESAINQQFANRKFSVIEPRMLAQALDLDSYPPGTLSMQKAAEAAKGLGADFLLVYSIRRSARIGQIIMLVTEVDLKAVDCKTGEIVGQKSGRLKKKFPLNALKTQLIEASVASTHKLTGILADRLLDVAVGRFLF